MSMPDPNLELKMKQSKFSDFNLAAMIICMSLVLTLVNLYEFFVNVRNYKKYANVILLVAILVTLQNSVIKVFEAAVYYPSTFPLPRF
jgi:hypothetical protein